MTKVALYDAKSYDRVYFGKISGQYGLEIDFHEFRLSAETAASASGADAVCVFVNDRIDEQCLSKLKELGVKHLALRCAGFNNVDLEAAGRSGVAVTRVPAYSPYAVAEHTIAILMALNRKIHRAHSRVRELNFSLHGLVGFDMHGKTIGVIGTGKIGQLTAQIFKAFGTRLIAFDPYPANDWATSNGIEYVDLDTVVSESDVISLHVPLMAETKHLFNKERFAQMKKGAYLVNTSRGALIDSAAMIESLKSQHLGGVALDVYEEEEGVFFEDLSDGFLPDDQLGRLLTFPNVLITAHQAFLTAEALTQIAEVTAENVSALAKGEVPLEGTQLS